RAHPAHEAAQRAPAPKARGVVCVGNLHGARDVGKIGAFALEQIQPSVPPIAIERVQDLDRRTLGAAARERWQGETDLFRSRPEPPLMPRAPKPAGAASRSDAATLRPSSAPPAPRASDRAPSHSRARSAAGATAPPSRCARAPRRPPEPSAPP